MSAFINAPADICSLRPTVPWVATTPSARAWSSTYNQFANRCLAVKTGSAWPSKAIEESSCGTSFFREVIRRPFIEQVWSVTVAKAERLRCRLVPDGQTRFAGGVRELCVGGLLVNSGSSPACSRDAQVAHRLHRALCDENEKRSFALTQGPGNTPGPGSSST